MAGISLVTKAFEGHDIRIQDRKGNPWFVADDIAKAIGHSNTGKMVKLVDDEYKTTITIGSSGSYTTNVIVLSEPGAWQVLARTRLPKAKPFQKWLYEEVLPSIRKTGGYIAPTLRTESSAVRRALTDQWKRHGADKRHHYVNLTRKTYEVLGFGKDVKKAEMLDGEILKLMSLEAGEAYHLMHTDDIHGFYELRDSLIKTGAALTGPVRKEIPA